MQHMKAVADWLRAGRQKWGRFHQLSRRLEAAGEPELAEWLLAAPVLGPGSRHTPVEPLQELHFPDHAPESLQAALQALQLAASTPGADPALTTALSALQALTACSHCGRGVHLDRRSARLQWWGALHTCCYVPKSHWLAVQILEDRP